MLGIVAVGLYSQEVPKIFRAPMYMAHHALRGAVIFAIALLSCSHTLLPSARMEAPNGVGSVEGVGYPPPQWGRGLGRGP